MFYTNIYVLYMYVYILKYFTYVHTYLYVYMCVQICAYVYKICICIYGGGNTYVDTNVYEMTSE